MAAPLGKFYDWANYSYGLFILIYSQPYYLYSVGVDIHHRN